MTIHTPADYRTALAVLDTHAAAGVSRCDEATFAAVMDMAAAEVEYRRALAAYMDTDEGSPDEAAFGAAVTKAEERLDEAADRLIALTMDGIWRDGKGAAS